MIVFLNENLLVDQFLYNSEANPDLKLGLRYIKNNIPAYWKAPQIFGQFVARSSHVGPFSQDMNFSVKGINESIRLRFVIFRNVTPNFNKVASSKRARNNDRHLYPFGMGVGAGRPFQAARFLDSFGVPGHRLAAVKPVVNSLP